MIDKQTNETLKKAEDCLKDRFSGYLIACLDGDKVYYTHNGTIIAMGLIDFIATELRNFWIEEGTEEAEEEV